MWAFKSAESAKMKRKVASVAGFYTVKEAADKIGVADTTLMDRVKQSTYDKEFNPLDARNEPLYLSYKRIQRKSYFEKTNFDLWADEYLTRPNVIAARMTKLGFATPAAPLSC